MFYIKKITTLIIPLMLIFSLCFSVGATGQVGISKFTDKINEENISYTSNWALISGIDDTEGQNKLNSVIKEQATERIEIAKNLSETGTSITGNYTFEVKRNSHGIASIVFSETLESNGINRQSYMKGITFNATTGKVYKLMELFKQDSNYINFINDEIMLQIKEKNLSDSLAKLIKDDLPLSDYYITDESIIIILPSDEYFSQESGFKQFPISLQRLKFMFTDELSRLIIE